jgi:uncharacterized delta-60 repeat protein
MRSFFRWLRTLTSTPSPRRPSANGRPGVGARPRLEALEDRCLLSGGVLDPTFGSGGVFTTAVGGQTSWAFAVATYPDAGTVNDGKVVVAGGLLGDGRGAVARYDPLNGTLDTSFGSGGLVTSPNGIVNDVKIQPDGKIVTADSTGGFNVVRYNATNGSLDRTFGTKGVVVTPFGKKSLDGAGRLALQPDGKIVVAGWTATLVTSTYEYDLALVRYNADGSLDTTFGTGGKVIEHFASGLSLAQGPTGLLDIALDPGSGPLDPDAGKIVVTAPLEHPVGPGSNVVFRFNTNGSLDTTFGGAGYVIPAGQAVAVAVQSDDRIVVTGTVSTTSRYDIGLARLNPDGTPDATFGSGGAVVTPAAGDPRARSLAIQADGKILVAGNLDYNFMVARYNPTDGSLDTSFGVNGIAASGSLQDTNHGGVPVAYEPVDVALEPDGRIVVVGSSFSNASYQFALARFLAAGPEIGSFTASSNPATTGSGLTLTASNISDEIPSATITQMAFYVQINGTNTLLGYGTQTSAGVWTLNYTVNLATGAYTLYAQAEDNYGVPGDPLTLTLQVP